VEVYDVKVKITKSWDHKIDGFPIHTTNVAKNRILISMENKNTLSERERNIYPMEIYCLQTGERLANISAMPATQQVYVDEKHDLMLIGCRRNVRLYPQFSQLHHLPEITEEHFIELSHPSARPWHMCWDLNLLCLKIIYPNYGEFFHAVILGNVEFIYVIIHKETHEVIAKVIRKFRVSGGFDYFPLKLDHAMILPSDSVLNIQFLARKGHFGFCRIRDQDERQTFFRGCFNLPNPHTPVDEVDRQVEQDILGYKLTRYDPPSEYKLTAHDSNRFVEEGTVFDLVYEYPGD